MIRHRGEKKRDPRFSSIKKGKKKEKSRLTLAKGTWRPVHKRGKKKKRKRWETSIIREGKTLAD